MTPLPRRSTIRHALVAAAVVGLVAFSQSALAETSARSAIATGERAFARGDFEAALSAFEAAYEAEPLPALLYNLAMCHWELDRIADAVNLFRRYLGEDEAIAAEDRAEVERILVELGPRHGDVLIDVAHPGAELLVDGRVVGLAPFDRPFAVEPGEHALSARLGDRTSATVTRQVDAGETESVALTIADPTEEPVVVTPPVAEPSTPATVESRPLPWWFWSPVALCAATGVAAAVTGALTLSTRNEYVEGGRLDVGAYERGRSLGVSTDVLIGIAATAAVGAVVAFLVHFVGERRRTERRADPALSIAR